MSSHNHDGTVLDTYQAVVSAFSDFLIVAIHTILYERDIYPKTSFLKARKYNHPVRQSRHPKVCQWIQDAIAAVEVEMLKCTISSTSLVLSSPPPLSQPLERYTFSTASFPQVPPSEHLTPFSPSPLPDPNLSTTTANPNPSLPTSTTAKTPLSPPFPPTQNLPVQFRATLSRLSSLLPSLSPLPPESTYTLAIELRPSADPPIGVAVRNERPWIAAEPGMQQQGGVQQNRQDDSKEKHPESPSDGESQLLEKGDGGKSPEAANMAAVAGRKGLQSVRMMPVRSVEAGAFMMEVWVEEGKGKLALDRAQAQAQAQADDGNGGA